MFGHEASACGAPLLFHPLPMANAGDLAGFWRCAKAPECEFVEYPPQRLLSPLLTLEALSLATFRVSPGPGSLDVLRPCSRAAWPAEVERSLQLLLPLLTIQAPALFASMSGRRAAASARES